ncbi:GSCFA domain-containing protein [Fulvivirga sp.]|uniref:GSCFA domain-containing protein n=1 Tax=Fulvivirga sp. TaxID=1931237 RepID=UPI0032EF20E1
MFRTELHIEPSANKIGLHSPILTIGSCFSDNIASKLSDNKIEVLANPFGTVYNPISIFKLLGNACKKEHPKTSEVVENDGLFAHYDFHSSFSKLNEAELTTAINKAVDDTHEFLKKTDYLIITFGTAFVYELDSTAEVVANCHKVPAKNFTKKLLTQKQVLEAFEEVYQRLMDLKPDLKIIITVSPVRHIKDTLALNSVSKSTLRLTCHTLENQYDNVAYFPSYELLMDDLRDYRFYKSDMLHPSAEAQDYIWSKFAPTYFDDQTQSFIKEWVKIKAAIDHRPFNPASEKHQQFIKATIEKIELLPQEISFSEELETLRNQLL